MKKIFTLACMLVACCLTLSAKKLVADEVKVISFNIRLINSKDGPNEWKYRAEASPAMIKDYALPC